MTRVVRDICLHRRFGNPSAFKLKNGQSPPGFLDCRAQTNRTGHSWMVCLATPILVIHTREFQISDKFERPLSALRSIAATVEQGAISLEDFLYRSLVLTAVPFSFLAEAASRKVTLPISLPSIPTNLLRLPNLSPGTHCPSALFIR